MMTLFVDARLKLRRAERHLTELKTDIDAYMERSPAHANVRPGPPLKDAGMVYHEIFLNEPIPIHLSTIIGDFVHNLRTSLDVLACELVRLNGGNTSKVYFPFAERDDELDRMIIKRGMNQASTEAQDLVRSLMPYKGGNTALRGVHDLDIIDKHRAIVPANGKIHLKYDPKGPGVGIQFPRTNRTGDEQTGMMCRGYVRAKWTLGERLPVAFDLIFPQNTPFAAEPIIPTCQSLVQTFMSVVVAFERLCFGASNASDR